ncbi:MAG: contractile injection system protein, VgrG/Pvc8 family, partial [Alcanivorax sp.]|nr:contractile injection system protein, VgrG/Pvc8 family [Alcanivorax sp.]
MDWFDQAREWVEDTFDVLQAETQGMSEHFTLIVDGLPLAGFALALDEALNAVSEYRIHCAVTPGTDSQALLGKTGELTLTGRDGRKRRHRGRVMAIHEQRLLADGQQEWLIELQSGLALLANRVRYRIVHHQSVPELVTALLMEYDLVVDNALTSDYPVHDWVAQVGETDLAFVQRLLAREGIAIYPRREEQGEALVLSGGPRGYRRANRPGLAIMPESTTVRSIAGHEQVALHSLRRHYRMQPRQSQVHQQCSPSQGAPRTHQYGEEKGTRQIHFMGAQPAAHSSRQQARLHQEYWDGQQHCLLASGPVADLQVGDWVPVDGVGNCLVVNARTRLALPREHQGNTPHPLHWEAQLLPLEQPFRPARPAPADIPLVFPATVESTEPYAQLDGEGRRQGRIAFDHSGRAAGDASPPLRQLQPFGGQSSKDGQSTGWDWPLRDGASILMTCLNNDPDQPLILGYAPSATQPGPVTAGNRSEYRLLTPAGHELNLNDRKKAECISLHTPDGRCLLQLNAHSEAPMVKLACEQGALVLRVGGNQTIQVDKSHALRVGQSLTTSVGKALHHQTSEGVLHHQADTDTRLSASQHATLKADKDLTLRTGGQLHARVQNNLQLNAKSLAANVASGDLHLQADQALTLKGNGTGDITLHQSGGGLTLKADGSIRLFGNKVLLKGQQGISFNGDVDYAVPGVVKADSPVPVALTQAGAIPEIDLPSIVPDRVKTLTVLPLRHGVFASTDPQAMEAVPPMPPHVPS